MVSDGNQISLLHAGQVGGHTQINKQMLYRLLGHGECESADPLPPLLRLSCACFLDRSDILIQVHCAKQCQMIMSKCSNAMEEG